MDQDQTIIKNCSSDDRTIGIENFDRPSFHRDIKAFKTFVLLDQMGLEPRINLRWGMLIFFQQCEAISSHQ